MGTKIRADLMDKCNLHTILRLPTGIFYAQGVKTNVLFFTRGTTDAENTQTVWVYDLRTNTPAFGKCTPLTHEHFADFEACYGSKRDGTGERVDQGEEGCFRCFTRQEIAKRGDNLDIGWLKADESHSADGLLEPDEVAGLIRERLQIALEEIDALTALLEGEEVEV
jgi:type I restriction enzyme M protein